MHLDGNRRHLQTARFAGNTAFLSFRIGGRRSTNRISLGTLMGLVVAGTLGSFNDPISANPIPWPPPASMPLEDMHVEIEHFGPLLYATFYGEFTFNYIPTDVTHMLFPLPPDAMGIEVRQDGASIPWSWSTELYPTILPELPTIPMIEWDGPFPQGGCVFTVEYRHSLIRRGNDYVFFYANGTGKYFDTYEKNTTAYFDIDYPECFQVKSVYWDDLPHAYQVDGFNLDFTVQSWYGPIIHDVIVTLAADPESCDTNGNGKPDRQDKSARIEFESLQPLDLVPPANRCLLTELNGDSVSDLVAGLYQEDSIDIRLGEGGGTFGSVTEYAATENSGVIVPHDLNSDGWTDLAVKDVVSGSVAFLLNRGDGTFAPKIEVATGQSFRSMGCMDLDADNDTDLILTDLASPLIQVWFNDGQLTFSASTTYTLPSSTRIAAFADMDGDHDIDILLRPQVSGASILLMANDGSGVFSAPVTVYTGVGIGLLSVGNFNSDAHPDLVVADGHNTIHILLNDGACHFTATGRYGVRPNPMRIIPMDLDGDGHIDLAIQGEDYYPPGEMFEFSYALTLLVNQGDGTFRPGRDLRDSEGVCMNSLTFGDVDGDGRVDLVALDSSIGTSTPLHVYLNRSLPPCVAPDFDWDHDVDAVDLDHYLGCLSGPAIFQFSPLCRNADLDGDLDVDQVDFGLLQRCFSGADQPADPQCAD